MKKCLRWLSIATVALPLAANAAIYRCTGNGASVVYQDTPCVNGYSSQLVIADSPVTAPAVTPVATPAVEAPEQTRETLFRSSRLTIGMLDTQVLNLKGWGRPAKIT